MKSYIYTGAVTLGVVGIITAVLLGGIDDKPDDNSAIYGNPSMTQSATPSASASPDADESSPEATPEAPTAEAVPVGPNVGENNQSLIEDGQDYDYTNPNQETVALAPPQEMRLRDDGAVYFINSETGEEISQPVTPPAAGTPIALGEGVAPVGAGTDNDKRKIAETYRDYLNALYNGDYEQACSHVNIPAGIGMEGCMAKLAQWNSTYPIASEYSVDQYKLTDIKGDSANVSPWVIKDNAGKPATQITLSRSANDPSVWLISEKVITQI